jgi:lysophospholipase L1-like esterase
MKGLGRVLLIGMVAVGLNVASAGAGDKDKEKTNPATTLMNRDIPRHKQFLAIAKKGGVEVLFLGDSITHDWEGRGREAWKKHFEPLKAANFGIGGDQTGHILWRLTEGKELEGITPKVAVLMIGTNNSGRDSAEQIAEGIKLIVKTIQEKSPSTKVLLLGIFPRRPQADDPIRKKLATVNKIVAKLDDNGKTVRYLDIGPKFLEADGSLSKDIMYDYLHLTPRGYEIWAEAITPTLTGMLKQ